ncbi:antitoxin [Thioalkalivibrio sp. AKL7]|uniref:antitoxin n=1 Tax=Thioalkalivibrio sp. AKL7 TaxID=1158155 RepID=UPI0004781C32|nr:type II toxin-antitoxin system VapB family antitoxin [Thioalkalivibrio sp. AKL7]
MKRRTASLFRNGRSQAVRLPKGFTFDTDEVVIEKHGDALILRAKPRSWDDYFLGPAETLPDDFPDSIEDRMAQDREAL